MITCNLMGGLGNQIFQIFATISYAIKSRNQFKFLNVTTLGGGSTTIRNTFWKSFFFKLQPFLIDNIPSSIHIIREKEFKFNPLSVTDMIGKDILISGYFQSYKYFEENYQLICKIIGLQKMKDDVLFKLNLNATDFNNFVSIHFRIGDYKKIQEYHPLATFDYYKNSINFIKNKSINIPYTMLYFCEDNDIVDVIEIVNKLQIEFPEYKFIRGENKLQDWEQMLLMSCCHHNIIANSSFSWWSAYFNYWNDKIICYPSVWFGTKANNDTKDLCPPQWNRISF